MKYDIKINEVIFYEKSISILWSAKNIGFGVLDIYLDLKNKNHYYVKTETMGKEFYQELLIKLTEYLFKNSSIIE